MTVMARTTARHVNTTSIPILARRPPMGPRGENSSSRMSPVATGGITSGSETNVSRSRRPRKRRRASSHASSSPGGIISTVAATAVSSVKLVICQMSMTPLSGYSPSLRGKSLLPQRAPRSQSPVAFLCALRGLGGEKLLVGERSSAGLPAPRTYASRRWRWPRADAGTRETSSASTWLLDAARTAPG